MMSINKKSATLGLIGTTPILAILSFIGVQFWERGFDWKEAVDHELKTLDKQVSSIQQKFDSDESQWQLLYDYDKRLKEVETLTAVNKELITIFKKDLYKNTANTCDNNCSIEDTDDIDKPVLNDGKEIFNKVDKLLQQMEEQKPETDYHQYKERIQQQYVIPQQYKK